MSDLPRYPVAGWQGLHDLKIRAMSEHTPLSCCLRVEGHDFFKHECEGGGIPGAG